LTFSGANCSSTDKSLVSSINITKEKKIRKINVYNLSIFSKFKSF